VLLYTDGSKILEDVAAGYCQVSAQGTYLQAKSLSLCHRIEIMDAELAAVYQALKDLQRKGTQNQEIHVFVDS